jgi:hypothetical protein
MGDQRKINDQSQAWHLFPARMSIRVILGGAFSPLVPG